MSTTRAASAAPAARWWKPGATAVVTGANKGIGFECARLLAEQGFSVKLTARTDAAGRDAVARLTMAVPASPWPPAYYLLEQRDPASVEALGTALERDCPNGVDVLICNAGFAFKGSIFGMAEAMETIAINYTGTALVCERLTPLLLASAAATSGAKPRVVNVCSSAGKLAIIRSEATRRRFEEAKTRADVTELMVDFVKAIQGGTHSKLFCNSMYGVSKLGQAIYTRVLARQLGDRALVSAVHPGYCASDMTSWRGTKSAADGADTPVWAALLPPDTASGQFYRDRTPEPF
eukprot:CAMPEP_0197579286 /NCGR_PEP_ID=MMETSP1326-20131121/3319_1 /TAXON_ID=1155430 /ORGANISM="Genus nov. species nov., Strain RCC2288" /LENGTH=291 /DNA_ID=CAMNT_0043142701 /DNA_START=54 /DNA_END=929 /DNA_ORIENTATION=+